MSDKEDTKPLVKDCLSCRITGALTFAGLTGYVLHTRANVPIRSSTRNHRMFLACIAGSTAMLAVWRAVGMSTNQENREDFRVEK
jgi:hypothetical protein